MNKQKLNMDMKPYRPMSEKALKRWEAKIDLEIVEYLRTVPELPEIAGDNHDQAQ